MRIRLRQRLQYQFDNLMAGGTRSLIAVLFLLSLALILIAAAVISLGSILQPGDGQQLTFGEAAWSSLIHTLDSGAVGGDSGLGFRAVMFGVSLGGIFLVSALIGILNNGLEARLEHLRKGRSLVLESDHTLILGFSPQIFTILNELMIANENKKQARIVILATQDKAEMEDQVRERVPRRGHTRIICRSGNPLDPATLPSPTPPKPNP